MIKNYQHYKNHVRSDLKSLGITKQYLTNYFVNDIFRFQLTLRTLEYLTNCKKSFVLRIITKWLFRRQSKKLGFTIPINVFDKGLAIAHYGTIVVNKNASVGENCRIHVCVNIGSNIGSTLAPKIGDNCYIAPGVKIYGDIVIASNIKIGANSVVNKSFLEENITIAGIPAKKISGN